MNFTPELLGQLPSPFYRVAVKALVFDDQGRLLVIRNEKDGYEIPGGGWEFGETYEECLKREIDEELGAKIKSIDDFCGIWVCSHHEWGYKMLRIAMRVSLSDFVFKPSTEVMAMEWIDQAKFMTIDWKYEGVRDEMAKIIWENKE